MSNISLSSLSSSEDEHLQFQAIYQFYHLSLLNSSTVVSPLFDDTIQFGQGYKLIYHLTYEDSVSESWFQKEDLHLFTDLLYPHFNFPDDCLTKDRVIIANCCVVSYESGLIIVLFQLSPQKLEAGYLDEEESHFCNYQSLYRCYL